MEKSIFDHYKDRENTKINLVIYGSFGYSAFAIHMLANKMGAIDLNISIVSLFLISLLLAVSAFYYWYASDYLNYIDHEIQSNPSEYNAQYSVNVRSAAAKTAFRCFSSIILSYLFSFYATLISFTSIAIFKLDKSILEILC